LHKPLSIWEIYRTPAALAHRLHYSDHQVEVDPKMALTKLQLIGELKHEINSPLAAIRNALYLVAARTDDPEIHRYLQLADHEAARVAQILKNANQLDENKRVHTLAPRADAVSAA
jgi:nitrogen-specific signal transduction histidine kinase